MYIPYPTLIGAVAIPAIPSNPISATSISCPATNLPATSPVDPPTASTPKPAPKAPNFLPVVKGPPLYTFAPTEPAKRAVAPSIKPIARPLPAALYLIELSASWSSNTVLTLSVLNSNSLSSNSFCNNSAKVIPVSNVAPAAPIAPPIVPIIGTNEPPTPPAIPAPMVDAFNNCVVDETKI